MGGKGERAGELDESGDGAGVKARSQNGTGWNFGTGAEKGEVAGSQTSSWTGNQAGEWAGAGAGGWDKTNLGEGAAGSWKGATKVLPPHKTRFFNATFKEEALSWHSISCDQAPTGRWLSP